MLNEQALIERPDYKVHFRSYSDKVYGYRVIIKGEPHYIINDRLMGDLAIETLYRLKDLSAEYSEFGFIMLQQGNKLYIEHDYKYHSKYGGYFHGTSHKVVDISKYRYTLHHGFEKYKDRWDSE